MHIQNFESDDLGLLKPLEPEGWGDLVPRFTFFLSNENMHPVKMVFEDKIVALGASITFPESVWLACIITHPDYRNRGLGGKMTKYLIDSVDRDQRPSINLIATPAGYPLYKRLGFITDSIYEHFSSVHLNIAVPDGDMPGNTVENDYSRIVEMDRRVSGEDRSLLLKKYLRDAIVYRTGNNLRGVYFPGLGEGMILAEDDEAGIQLMNRRLITKTDAVIPVDNQSAIHHLKVRGILPYRISTRMYIGKKTEWRPGALFNRIGGQLG